MKKLGKFIILGLVLVLFSMPVSANDKWVLFADTIVAADTVPLTSMRADTVYSPAFRVSDYGKLWFSLSIGAFGNDTVWSADTFTVAIEHSYDKLNWALQSPAAFKVIVKGAADTVGILPTIMIRRDSTNMGNWGRVRWIHNDSIATSIGNRTLPGNIYVKKLTAWYSGVK